MKQLSRLEEIYLLTIWRLKDNAYGVTIKKSVAEQTGKKVSYGALYFTLEQIFNKGYVTKSKGDPTPVRGGCSKIYYQLTNEGKEALKSVHELQKSIWDGISVVALDEGNTK